MRVKDAFDLSGRVIIVTGAAGLLGQTYVEAIAEMGGSPVLLDVRGSDAERRASEIAAQFEVRTLGLAGDVTSRRHVADALSATLETFGRIDGLINNAANDPKVESRQLGTAVMRAL